MLVGRSATPEIGAALKKRYAKAGVRERAGCRESGQAASGYGYRLFGFILAHARIVDCRRHHAIEAQETTADLPDFRNCSNYSYRSRRKAPAFRRGEYQGPPEFVPQHSCPNGLRPFGKLRAGCGLHSCAALRRKCKKLFLCAAKWRVRPQSALTKSG
jgi:hypothetical protein